MESFKDKAGSMTGMDNLKGMLGDISFPASKDDVVKQLKEKGAPSMVTDKLQHLDISQFSSADELTSKLGGSGK